MYGPKYPGLATLALHAGAAPDPACGARATAIHFSAGYAFQDSDQAAALLHAARGGHADALTSNPTNAVLEQRIAALEGGVAGVATASGQAALHLAISTIAGAGAHIVAARALDDGVRHLLEHGLKRFGVATSFVDGRDPDAWAGAIRRETRLLLGATLGGPGLDVCDIPTVAAVAHDHQLPLLLDASLSTPWLLRPFEHGADLLFHNTAGFLCGHGSALGGLLVDAGSFDWQAAYDSSGRYAELCEPDDGAHGMVYSEESSVAAFALRARRAGLADFGAAMSPHNAHAILQGLKTLGLRMERHVANARKVVEFLLEHSGVLAVAYPELATHPDHALAARLLPRGSGAVLSFTLKGDGATARRCVDALQLFSHGTGAGDAQSLVSHPASSTHAHLPVTTLAAHGIDAAALRLSVGLEDADDLIADLRGALARAQKGG